MVAATTLIQAADDPFERLFVQEYRRAVSIALRITGDPEDARDVAQEAFVRLARARHPDDPRARGWLYSATVHVALNTVRSRSRRHSRETRAEVAHANEDPQAIVEREFDRALVRAALLRLNARDAEILALRYGGLSYREIAGVLGVDAAQIGTRLARAERAFRKEMEREPS